MKVQFPRRSHPSIPRSFPLQSLRKVLADTQDEHELHRAIKQFIGQLESQADALNCWQMERNSHVYWNTRGQQELLHFVALCLQRLCLAYDSSYKLYLALKDYLRCLEKYAIDIEEEKRAPRAHSGHLTWKAQGAGRELPTVFADLIHLLSQHRPSGDQHMLSLDGKAVILL